MKKIVISALLFLGLGAAGMTLIGELAHAQSGSGSAVLVPAFEPPTADAGIGSGSAVTAPAPATTATVPDPATDTEGFLKALLDAATTGKWKVLAGLVLVALVYVTRRWVLGRVAWFQTKLGGFVLAGGMSLAGTIGLALAAGGPMTIAVLLNALGTAATAAGVWQWMQSSTGK